MKPQQNYLHPYCQPDIKHTSQLKTESLASPERILNLLPHFPVLHISVP